MELQVVDTEGVPEGCILSIRAGATRRQAPVAADRPFRFPTTAAEATPLKVDVLEPIASARLILRPGEEKRTDCQYTIPLEPSGSDQPTDKGDAKKKESDMNVTIAVAPADDGKDDDKGAKGGDGDSSRPDSSSKASRHGQANAAREYLDKHNLVEFTQLLVQSVIKEQPDRPYAFMAKQFYFPDPKPRTGTAAAEKKAAEVGPTAPAAPAAPAAA